MKRLMVLGAVLCMFLAGCGKEGPMGPSGPAGATGSQGPGGTNNQHSVVADIVPDTSKGQVTISCPGLKVDTATGTVSTIAVYAYRAGDLVMVALPGRLKDLNSTFFTNLSFTVAPDKVILSWEDGNYMDVPATFKVVVSYVNP